MMIARSGFAVKVRGKSTGDRYRRQDDYPLHPSCRSGRGWQTWTNHRQQRDDNQKCRRHTEVQQQSVGHTNTNNTGTITNDIGRAPPRRLWHGVVLLSARRRIVTLTAKKAKTRPARGPPSVVIFYYIISVSCAIYLLPCLGDNFLRFLTCNNTQRTRTNPERFPRVSCRIRHKTWSAVVILAAVMVLDGSSIQKIAR